MKAEDNEYQKDIDRLVVKKISEALKEGGASDEGISAEINRILNGETENMVTNERIDLQSRIIEVALDTISSLGMSDLSINVHGDVISIKIPKGTKADHVVLSDNLRFNISSSIVHSRPLCSEDIDVKTTRGGKILVSIKNTRHSKTSRIYRHPSELVYGAWEELLKKGYAALTPKQEGKEQ